MIAKKNLFLSVLSLAVAVYILSLALDPVMNTLTDGFYYAEMIGFSLLIAAFGMLTLYSITRFIVSNQLNSALKTQKTTNNETVAKNQKAKIIFIGKYLNYFFSLGPYLSFEGHSLLDFYKKNQLEDDPFSLQAHASTLRRPLPNFSSPTQPHESKTYYDLHELAHTLLDKKELEAHEKNIMSILFECDFLRNSIHRTNFRSVHPIWLAAQAGNLDAFKIFREIQNRLMTTPIIRNPRDNKKNLLHLACESGNLQFVKHLCEDEKLCYMLGYHRLASWNNDNSFNQEKTLKAILKIKGNFGQTYLHYACTGSADDAMVRYLLDKQPKLANQEQKTRSQLSYGMPLHALLTTLKQLEKKEEENKSNATALKVCQNKITNLKKILHVLLEGDNCCDLTKRYSAGPYGHYSLNAFEMACQLKDTTALKALVAKYETNNQTISNEMFNSTDEHTQAAKDYLTTKGITLTSTTGGAAADGTTGGAAADGTTRTRRPAAAVPPSSSGGGGDTTVSETPPASSI